MAYINKEYSEANEFLSVAIDKGGRPRSYFVRGKSYARQGEHEKALMDFNAAINENKEDGDYYYWRAKSFAAVKRYDESLMDIQRAYALKPDDKWINKFRLKLLAYAKRPDILTVDGAANGSGAAEALFRQAKELIESNQPGQAKVTLDRAIEMSPGEFRYYQLADHALFVQGKTRDILGYWEAYLSIKPNDHRAYLERAGTYYHLQDFDAAKIDAKRAMELGNAEARQFYKQLQELTKG
jgi:tetratricopeptide (TPR) repeat protein